DLAAYRAVFNSTNNPATQFAGKYTLVIPGSEDSSASPGGDGYGAVTVSSNGSVKVSGYLADGKALSQSVPISRNGDWALYQAQYSGTASVFGWLAFDTNQPAAEVNGLVSWIK